MSKSRPRLVYSRSAKTELKRSDRPIREAIAELNPRDSRSKALLRSVENLKGYNDLEAARRVYDANPTPETYAQLLVAWELANAT